MPCGVPQVYDFPSTRSHKFRLVSAKSNSSATCTIVLLLLVFMIMWNMRTPYTPPVAAKFVELLRIDRHVKTMMSHVSARFVSARASLEKDDVDAPLTKLAMSADATWGEGCQDPNLFKNIYNLTECNQGDKCVDWKKCDEDTKATYGKNLVDWLKKMGESKHKGAVVMFFAPWCPHCHTFMPIFMQASGDDEERPYAVVNAELLPRTLYNGKDKALGDNFALEAFPTVQVFDENGKAKYQCKSFDKTALLIEVKAAFEQTPEENPEVENLDLFW